jgi:glycosyltransferase involved in cell wall biosynthesis
MRIAFITTMATAPWGGSEALWAATASRALDAGHRIFVSVYDWVELPPAVAELEARGAQIHRRKVSRRWRRSGILMRLFYPFRALHDFNPDVVLINQGSTYDISRGKEFTRLRDALVRDARWPFVLLCHCEQDAPSRRRSRERARVAFAAARIVGMLSQNLRARSEQHLGISLPHARYFQNPLKIKGTRLLPWPQTNDLRFAFVGRLEHVKGLDLAIQVLSSPAWRERNWILDIYGDGELRAAYQLQVANLGLTDRIRFAGFTCDIDAVWRDHHLLLLPSRAEGVPNSMMEAMLSGRPVIVSNVGGISEWVSDGKSAYLLAKPDAGVLTTALERCWAERSSLEQMGRSAYENTIKQRDLNPATTMLNWIEEVGAGRREPRQRPVLVSTRTGTDA